MKKEGLVLTWLSFGITIKPMADVVPIHEAKTQLSKLIKRAHQGESILIGSYGKAEAVLGPLPERTPIHIGVWEDKKVADFNYDSNELVESDSAIVERFQKSIAEEFNEDEV